MSLYSVIVPVFNAAGTIGKCLSALEDQSIPKEEYEIIVVDDGSTDGTGSIVKKFPVKYIRQPNQGPASARNNGAREASGKIILFTDADCIPAYKWVEEMTKSFEKTEVVAVKGAYKTNQRSLISRLAQTEFEERFEMLKRAESIDMVDTYSAAFRRDIFWQAGGFDESFPVANNEDTDLSYKLSSAGYKMVFNPEAIVYHLRHPDTLLEYARLKFGRGYWRMVVYKRFPTKMVRDTYTPQILKFQILFLFGIVPFLILSTLLKIGLYLSVLLFIAFFISTLPFSLSAMKRDFRAGLISPFFLATRAFSIGLGVLYFFYKQIGDIIKK